MYMDVVPSSLPHKKKREPHRVLTKTSHFLTRPSRAHKREQIPSLRQSLPEQSQCRPPEFNPPRLRSRRHSDTSVSSIFGSPKVQPFRLTASASWEATGPGDLRSQCLPFRLPTLLKYASKLPSLLPTSLATVRNLCLSPSFIPFGYRGNAWKKKWKNLNGLLKNLSFVPEKVNKMLRYIDNHHKVIGIS